MRSRHVVIVTSLLAGCAGPYAEESAYVAGWRVAEVIEVGPASSLSTEVTHDCRDEHSGEASPGASAAYAVLRYSDGTRHHRVEATAAVLAGMSVQPGQKVYVNIHDCGAALVPHARLLG